MISCSIILNYIHCKNKSKKTVLESSSLADLGDSQRVDRGCYASGPGSRTENDMLPLREDTNDRGTTSNHKFWVPKLLWIAHHVLQNLSFHTANVASRIWCMEYYQLWQNPELHKSLQTSTKFPFPAHVSNSGVWNLCHIYYWRFRASNLETLTQLTLGSPQTTGPLTAWRTLIWWRHVKGLKNCLS